MTGKKLSILAYIQVTIYPFVLFNDRQKICTENKKNVRKPLKQIHLPSEDLGGGKYILKKRL